MEHFINRAGRALRTGITTGSCAALAARAAARMLLTGGVETESTLTTPKGVMLTVPVLDVALSASEARCAVRKDAGDDPDVTNGVLVYAAVKRASGDGIRIDGGEGIGRVTKPGLDQPVGAAAINSVPRMMIDRAVRDVCREFGYEGGMDVVIAIPGGDAVAAGTFNPNLGIEGGLSILGTSGIVEPMSTQAVIDTMRVEMNVLRAQGRKDLIVTPGNYGERFIGDLPALARRPYVKCSNYIGEALDAACAAGFGSVMIVGHIGKFIKLSGGVMDTHSRVADCRLELLALHAALAGGEPERLRRILDAATVDEGVEILGERRGEVVDAVLERAEMYCGRRAGKTMGIGLILFSNRLGLLGISGGARRLLEKWEGGGE